MPIIWNVQRLKVETACRHLPPFQSFGGQNGYKFRGLHQKFPASFGGQNGYINLGVSIKNFPQ